MIKFPAVTVAAATAALMIATPANASAATRDCGKLVTVRGAAFDVRATGTTCANARRLINAAFSVGRGACCAAPMAFKIKGYRCTPQSARKLRYRCRTTSGKHRTVSWVPAEVGA